MSTPTLYRFNINETPNNKVEANRFSAEVRDSNIIISLDHVDTSSSYFDVWFKDELSSIDETTLSGIVVSHTGATYYAGPPVMSDGRPIVRSDTRPLGTQTYFTSAGDCPNLVNGTCPGGQGNSCVCVGAGQAWMWNFGNQEHEYNPDSVENGPTLASGQRAKLVHAAFAEPVYIKDGTLYFLDATYGSYLSMYITVPSGNYYPNPSGTIPASALGQSGDHMYAYATNDVFYVAYVNRQYMLGDCPMGDGLNAEASSVSAVPAGWYISGLIVTDEDNTSFKGHGSLEMYRRSTCMLPGGALNGEYSSEE